MEPKSNEIIERIFSYDFIKNSDKDKILSKKNYSSQIISNNSNFLSSIKNEPIIQNCFKIKHIPHQGIIINQSGTYTFECDIKWHNKCGGVAITIGCSDVIIDFNNKYLKNSSNNKHVKTVGIQSIGNNNITISNGCVYDMSYYGIQIEGCVNLTISNILVSGINLSDLETRLLTPCGIFVSKSESILINKSKIMNHRVKTDSCACVQLSECINGIITNCEAKNILNKDGAVQGYSLILCENIDVISCSSKKFRSEFNGNILTSGHTVLGFCPIFCLNILINNCDASDLYGTCDDSHGLSVFLNESVKVNNFYASNIYDGLSQSNSGAKATGLEVYGIDVSVSNSFVENIIAINPQDKQSTGFSAAGINITFNNCKSKNVHVVDSNNKYHRKLGNGCGFGWAPDPRPEFRIINAYNVLYLNCTAIDCEVGFDTFNHIDSTWNNIECINCCKCVLNKKNCKRTISCNPCSECNPSIIITLFNNASGNQFTNDKNKYCCK